MSRDRIPSPTARELAPHVDPDWADAFVLEARLLAVPGDRIGDALKEVEAHCLDSGASAADAFGDAEAYARSVAGEGPRIAGSWTPHLWPLGLQVAGMSAVIAAVGALAQREPVTMTWGSLALVATLLAGSALLALLLDRALRFVLRRPWVSALALGAALTAMLVLAVSLARVLDAPIAQLPVPAAAGAGAALLVVGIALEWRMWRRTADPLVDPTHPAESARGTVPPGIWTVLVATAVGCAVVWLLSSVVG